MNKSPNVQWLLENGQSIVIRNLLIPSHLADASSSPPSSPASVSTISLISPALLPKLTLEILSEHEGSVATILTSDDERQGTCPTWSICGLSSTPFLEKHYYSTNITIRLYLMSKHDRHLISEEKFDLSALQIFKVAGTLSGTVYYMNTILLAIVDDYYTTSKPSPNGVLSNMPNNNTIPKYLEISQDNTRSAYFLQPDSYQELRRKYEQTQEMLLINQAKFSNYWSGSSSGSGSSSSGAPNSSSSGKEKTLQAKKQTKLVYLQTLRNYLKELEAAKQREKFAETYCYTKAMKIQNLEQSKENIEEINDSILVLRKEISARSEILLKLKFAIEAKQMKLLYELYDVFPIEIKNASSSGGTVTGGMIGGGSTMVIGAGGPASGGAMITSGGSNPTPATTLTSVNGVLVGGAGYMGECYIKDIELPNDLSIAVKDDDVVASGLGYVVHLLLLISKYLEVPLRYQLLYMGSRSLVRDPMAAGYGSTYPLFKRSIEKERFEKAVSWLKGDIELLLSVRGLTYDPSKHFLANLQMLFQCDGCAKSFL